MGTQLSLAAMRQNLRRLSKQRGFTLTVLLTLGLCIGANIAIFAIVDAVLLKPLPFPEQDRLVTTYNSYPGAGVERASSSLPNYYDRREGLAAFESLSMIQYGSGIVGEAGSPDRVQLNRVSHEFFETLQVPLLMGRTFTDDEMLHTNSGVTILTYEFWQNYFNGMENILGENIMVDGFPKQIIGVLPQGFNFLSRDAEFYLPASSNLEDREAKNRHSNNYFALARLKDGVSLESAQSQIDAFNIIQLGSDPFAHLVGSVGFKTYVKNLHDDHVAEIKTTLLMLQGGVLCLLLIGGVNIANLILIRASGRSKEMAVRQALGAGRRHIVKETLYETLTLTIAGGLLGLLIGTFGIRLMGMLDVDKLPLGSTVALDTRVAFAALFSSLLVGIALAVPVVWFHLKGQLATTLHSESRSGTVSRATHRVHHAFIVTQIALTFILLTGAGMLSISLKKVTETSPGFNPVGVTTARLSLPWKRYQKDEDRLAFADRMFPALEGLPGVGKVALTTNLPFSGSNSNNAIAIEGLEYNDEKSLRAHFNAGVEGEYWQIMGIPLKEGRLLDSMDARGDRRVCVIDEDFAAHYWGPGENPIGKRVCSDAEFKVEEAFTIVGVVGSVTVEELGDTSASGSIYFPYKFQTWNSFSLVMETQMDSSVMTNAMRKTILNLDPELPVDDLKTMSTRIEDSLTTRRSPALLANIFAGVALLLAGIGTYGVIASAVAQRQREVGVRMALGASPSQVRVQFMILGLRLLSYGLIIGVIGSWFVGRSMNGLLYDMPTFHLVSVAAAAALMALVSQLACLLPSMKASRVPPTVALSEAGA